MRPVRILLDRVGPESVRGGPAIFRRTRVLLVVAVVVANAVGAGVVFVFSAWVAPHPTVSASTKHVILANFALLAVFLPLALLVGTLWGTRRLRGARAWLEEERDPDEEERGVIVRAPARITMVVAVLWLVGAVAFGGLNATFSGKLALVVAVTVLLGGVTTMA